MRIENPEIEALAVEVAGLANQTKEQAIRTALQERKERLLAKRSQSHRAARIDRFLRNEAWPQVPAAVLGRPISKPEREALLGLDREDR